MSLCVSLYSLHVTSLYNSVAQRGTLHPSSFSHRLAPSTVGLSKLYIISILRATTRTIFPEHRFPHKIYPQAIEDLPRLLIVLACSLIMVKLLI